MPMILADFDNAKRKTRVLRDFTRPTINDVMAVSYKKAWLPTNPDRGRLAQHHARMLMACPWGRGMRILGCSVQMWLSIMRI